MTFYFNFNFNCAFLGFFEYNLRRALKQGEGHDWQQEEVKHLPMKFEEQPQIIQPSFV